MYHSLRSLRLQPPRGCSLAHSVKYSISATAAIFSLVKHLTRVRFLIKVAQNAGRPIGATEGALRNSCPARRPRISMERARVVLHPSVVRRMRNNRRRSLAVPFTALGQAARARHAHSTSSKFCEPLNTGRVLGNHANFLSGAIIPVCTPTGTSPNNPPPPHHPLVHALLHCYLFQTTLIAKQTPWGLLYSRL